MSFQNKYLHVEYENEGFLYINSVSTETFKKGEIKDINNNIICPGVIVPIFPIKEEYRDIGDDHLVSIETFMNQMAYYYPLQKYKNLRIYWVELHEVFVISTEMIIYITNDEKYDMSSVNFELLDKTKCYYCITDSKKNVILTNIVDIHSPCLETSYDIDEDLAFANHINWINIQNYTSTTQLLDHVNNMDNGMLCILKDGRQLELRNVKYSYYCSLAKPGNLSIYIYFIMCLNKHAEGNNYLEYFNSLHDYVREFTNAYPEYTRQCNIMSNRLRNYINFYEFEEILDLQVAINKLLEIEPDELLQLLLKY